MVVVRERGSGCGGWFVWQQQQQRVRPAEMSSKGRLVGDLTEREQERLKMRRDSDTKAGELEKMEKMLQQTKGMFEKKAESSSEAKNYEENMGVYLRSFTPGFIGL